MKTKKIKELEEYFINKTEILFELDEYDLEYGVNGANDDYSLEISFTDMVVNKTTILDFDLEDSVISCGNRQIFNLPPNAVLSNILSRIKPEYRDIFLTELLKEYFKLVKKVAKCCFLSLSNTNHDTYSQINKILDKLAVNKTRWKVNPNSGNTIKIWIL